MKFIHRLIISIIVVCLVIFGGRYLFYQHLENTSITNRAPTNSQWLHSSENKPYPNVNQYPHLWLLVSKSKQRVFLINHGKVLYTMYASTGSGKSNQTPNGTYRIQAERGLSFFNAKSGEGARYWVSWKNHGEYLFHSVPINHQGQYLVNEAQELGKAANSHGCIRLSVPDARWLYQNIKQGTKVVITNS
ncbi:L,D-transpeptidase [uncultured Limosilactobacillus sp.]|uniref:L,D-transpeptidase n=1 Tax=uncultured Limosilactobacillus sp. TaxID=2837629 RepID=UPI0025F93CB0|nr:L,D-transpeptidase [uncultured Limosilactobacillus sp.]